MVRASLDSSDPQRPVPLPYRGEIDGLRAVAVMSVVLYHFGAPIPGGFTGVDIFFVISGFLIGSILWREYIQTGTIGLWDFYQRRFRRLAPAFFVMLAATSLAGWVLVLPFEYREYGKTVIAATLYLSNVLFFRGAGYFDTASEDKPLLHTWSLAVEEQFYIVLPILILLLARWRWGLVTGLVLIWAGSLAACVLMTPAHPTATFYLFPFRAWELLSGVLLAIWGCETNRRWTGHAALSWLGLALIVVSVVAVPAGPLFPGVLAVLPVLGTLLVLANGAGKNTVNHALCHPVAVFFGAITYSLYLWHWPVFTLSSYLRDGYANIFEAALWMTLSVVLAWVSWRFIENPIRHARRLPGKVVLTATALASVAALGFGGWVYAKNGLSDRFGPEARVHIAASQDFLQDWSRCQVAPDLPLQGLEVCRIGPEGDPKVLVWGDSHLRAFREGLDLAAHEAGVPGLLIWRAGCPPLLGLRKTESAATPEQDKACELANLQIGQSFGRLESLQSVLLIGRWGYYTSGTGYGRDAENTIALLPREAPLNIQDTQSDIVTAAAKDTVAHLRHWVGPVYVLRQAPEIPGYDSRDAAREAAHSGLLLAAQPSVKPKIERSSLAQRAALADAPWKPLAQAGLVTFLDPWPFLCGPVTCDALYKDVGQYFDTNHVTNSAALRLRSVFAPVFHGLSDHANLMWKSQ